ncbi:MAG: substrate-binding domain-containing protein [Flavipsychrobacter sp.]|nr:substrate-binding domain-containing protein [Flavipsychrobacter sp.]
MDFKKVYGIIKIDDYSATPKYLQLVNSILNGINLLTLVKDDLLPSINELSYHFDISRDTAEKGYAHLKKLDVIGSVPGKGYYIKNVNFKKTLKIFLLFNKLSAHKKIIYDSFAKTLGDNAAIDFYIYNNDFSLFKKLLTEKKESEYTHYVIIPHFMDNVESVPALINTIPKHKLLLLDKLVPGITGAFSAVYENFSNDIYNALNTALIPLRKYNTLKVIFPDNSYYPVEIVHGFKRFCNEHNYEYKVIHDIAQEPINKGEAYINLMEDDLVILIERIITSRLKVGKDVGVISYNETPMKKIILNGITTISTDFFAMGEMAARLILQQDTKHLEVPFHLTLRNSL